MTLYRWKGLKDYKRSEKKIREDVSDQLSDSHDLDASEIDVKVQDTKVILIGQVKSKSEKRHAENIAEGVSGMTNVHNLLRISQQDNNGNNHVGSETSAQQQLLWFRF